jgi:flagellar basal-body rod modification protein FlgD
MSAISSLTPNAATSASDTTKKVGANETEDRFLKLLVAQLRNQDPLKPLDNAEVTSQMAQINTVQGISKMNESMVAMLSQFENMQAVSLAGKTVLVEGNSLKLAETETKGKFSARGGFELAADADQVYVDVKDSTGKLVTSIALGNKGAGMSNFNWDGAIDAKNNAPAGDYTFEVRAQSRGKPVDAVTLANTRVDGVIRASDGIRLNTANGSVLYSNVRMVS